jgi:hypothetical protein
MRRMYVFRSNVFSLPIRLGATRYLALLALLTVAFSFSAAVRAQSCPFGFTCTQSPAEAAASAATRADQDRHEREKREALERWQKEQEEAQKRQAAEDAARLGRQLTSPQPPVQPQTQPKPPTPEEIEEARLAAVYKADRENAALAMAWAHSAEHFAAVGAQDKAKYALSKAQALGEEVLDIDVAVARMTDDPTVAAAALRRVLEHTSIEYSRVDVVYAMARAYIQLGRGQEALAALNSVAKREDEECRRYRYADPSKCAEDDAVKFARRAVNYVEQYVAAWQDAKVLDDQGGIDEATREERLLLVRHVREAVAKMKKNMDDPALLKVSALSHDARVSRLRELVTEINRKFQQQASHPLLDEFMQPCLAGDFTMCAAHSPTDFANMKTTWRAETNELHLLACAEEQADHRWSATGLGAWGCRDRMSDLEFEAHYVSRDQREWLALGYLLTDCEIAAQECEIGGPMRFLPLPDDIHKEWGNKATTLNIRFSTYRQFKFGKYRTWKGEGLWFYPTWKDIPHRGEQPTEAGPDGPQLLQ